MNIRNSLFEKYKQFICLGNLSNNLNEWSDGING